MAFVLSSTFTASFRQSTPDTTSPVRAARVGVAPSRMMSEPLNPLETEGGKPMKETYDLPVGKKAAMCRCWKSETFPLCNGSHNKYNRETGDHLGPIVMSGVEVPIVHTEKPGKTSMSPPV
jgi:CDGSH-type Zn-finger protein